MAFIAKYDGRCTACKGDIYEGDSLDFADGSVVHSDCLPDAMREEVPRPTCPKCWQVIAANGACGCEDD